MRNFLLFIFLVMPLSYINAQWVTNGSKIYYNSGNVGIGITDPLYKLSVKGGPAHFDTNTGSHPFYISRNTGLTQVFKFTLDDRYGYVDYIQDETDGEHGFVFNISSGAPTHKFLFRSNNNDWFEISDGKIGIGVSPSYPIHVHSGGAADVAYFTNGTGSLKYTVGYNQYSVIYLGGKDISDKHYIISYGTGHANDGLFAIKNGDTGGVKSGQIQFFSGNTSVPTMTLLSNKNVGIGNTNPTEKLVVDGKILAEEVKVQTVPASDFVFEPDYNLPSIQEMESFIKSNKHLPDIPSAKEFKENGIGLGEMDNLLLKKVEELTLYLIDMQQQIDQLKKENKELLKMATDRY